MNVNMILNAFDEIIYVSDVQTYDMLYMNTNCTKVAGCSDYHNKKCYALLHQRDSPCPFCTNHLLNEDTFYVWEYNNPYLGRYFSLKDKLVEWDGRKARIEFALDISPYKSQIDIAESKIDSIIQSIPGGICLAEPTPQGMKVLWHNDHYLDIIGYTKEQFRTELSSMVNYVHADDWAQVAEACEECKRTGQPQTIHMRVTRRDGTIRSLMTSLSYYKNPSSGATCFYSIGIDVTDYQRKEEEYRKDMQEALRLAQEASKAKTRFLSHMSHEIRTPLNAVIGMAAIASTALTDTAFVQDCHKKIDHAANYLLSLINDILDMSRIESDKLLLAHRPFDFRAFVDGISSLFTVQAQSRGVSFDLRIPVRAYVQFVGDDLHLKQVLVNLLSNAMKFTPRGGRISMRVGTTPMGKDMVRLSVEVQDTGIGIKPEALNRVFETFEQADSNTTSEYGGSGLGLAISKRIVEMMGGQISAESTLGQGTTFTVWVPLCLHTGEPLELHCGKNVDFSGKRVLVAEDNDINMEISTEILHAKNIIVEQVPNGKAAVELFNASAVGHFDAILMDIRMPIMDGMAATRAIRALARPDALTVPIIALSANAFEEDRRASLACGMSGHISKPIDTIELYDVLARCMRA